MEKIRIKTAGPLRLDAWKNDKIQFIILEDLLKAMQVEYVEDVIEYIKQDLHWYISVKQIDIPEIGIKDVIQITKALGLIFWLPIGVVEFLPKHEVYNILAVHLELHLEFFQWKLDGIEKYSEKIEWAHNEMLKANDIIITNQALLIDELKKNFNLL